MPILTECLKIIRQDNTHESCLIITDSARCTLEQETDLTVDDLKSMADHIFDNRNIGAGPASGTYRTAGMLIVPCSMKTIAGIHSGYTDNLLLRAADVTLKEHRPLILAARETPLNPIHLRNMADLSMMPNVRIIPPMLTYYIKPERIEDMTYHIAAKLLEPFGIEGKKYRRWKGIGNE